MKNILLLYLFAIFIVIINIAEVLTKIF